MRPTIPSRNYLIFECSATRDVLSAPRVVLILGALALNFFMSVMNLQAKEEEAEVSKSSSVQNVGGLLFDVDEGVKIEKGGGGSVYVKSNREEMQEKFRQIEVRFESLEKRLEEIEKRLPPKEDSAGKKGSESLSESDRRVLAT